MAKWRATGIRFLRAALPLALLLSSCSHQKPAPESPHTVYERARQAYREGALEEAKALLEPLRPLWEQSAGRDAEQLRLLKIDILISQAEFDEAALLLARTAPTDPELRVLHAVAWATELSKFDKHSAGLALLEEAAPVAAKLGNPELEAVVAGSRGTLHLRAGHYNEAEQYLRQALQAADGARDDYDASMTLINQSQLSFRRGRLEDAIRLAEEAETRARAVRAQRWVGAAIGQQAMFYSNLGMMDRARQLREKAIAIQQRMNDRYLLQQSLGEMGNLYYRLENWRYAADYYRQAFNMAQSMRGGGSSAIWAGNLAQAEERAGNFGEAARWNEQARQLKVVAGDVSSLPYVEVTAAEIEAQRGQKESAVAKLEAVIKEGKGDAGIRWSAHAALARVLTGMGRFPEADEHFQAAIRLIDTERAKFGDAVRQISFLARLIGFYQDYVDALMERGDAKTALIVAESSRARILRERFGQRDKGPGASIEELQQASRRTGAALLSYWIAPRRGWLWVVTPREVRWFSLPPEEELSRLLERHQKLVEQGSGDPLRDAASLQLSKTLLEPALSLLGAAPVVIVVPDGAMNRVNLETLPVNGAYWIEQATVSVAPSLLALSTQRDRPRGKLLPLLAIGDPEQADPQYGRLKFARQELEGVSRQEPGAQLLEGAQANPAAYLQAKPERFRMIHFAAHAEANRDSPLNSAIILSRDGQRYRLRVSDVAEHPLQAELVTVSGCRSAGARAYSGEGLVGFAWGFLQAGAHGVVTGLWNVDDESTASLMTAVYGALARGRPPAAALREAKLSVLHGRQEWRRPFHWAPFQLYVR